MLIQGGICSKLMVQTTSSIGIQKGILPFTAGVIKDRVMEGVGLEQSRNEGREGNREDLENQSVRKVAEILRQK